MPTNLYLRIAALFILLMTLSSCRNPRIQYKGQRQDLKNLKAHLIDQADREVLSLEDEVDIANTVVKTEVSRIEALMSMAGISRSDFDREKTLAQIACLESYMEAPTRLQSEIGWDKNVVRYLMENRFFGMGLWDTRNIVAKDGFMPGIPFAMFFHTLSTPFLGLGLFGHGTTCALGLGALADIGLGWATDYEVVHMNRTVKSFIDPLQKEKLKYLRLVLEDNEIYESYKKKNNKDKEADLVMTYQLEKGLVSKEQLNSSHLQEKLPSSLHKTIIGGRVGKEGIYKGNYYQELWEELHHQLLLHETAVQPLTFEKFDHISYTQTSKPGYVIVRIIKKVRLLKLQGEKYENFTTKIIPKLMERSGADIFIEIPTDDLLKKLEMEYPSDQKE